MDKELFSTLYTTAKKAGITDCNKFKPIAYILDNEFKVATPKQISIHEDKIKLQCDNWDFFLGENGLEDFDDVPNLTTIIIDFLMTALDVDSSTQKAFDKWKYSDRPAYIVGTEGSDWMFLSLHEARCYANANLCTGHSQFVTIERVNWTKEKKASLLDYEDAVESFINDESEHTTGTNMTFQLYPGFFSDNECLYTGKITGIDLIAALTENSFKKDWSKSFPKYRIAGTNPDNGKQSFYDIPVLSEKDENGEDDILERLSDLRSECTLKTPTLTKF